MMTDEAGHACERKPLIYGAVSFLVMLGASANLEAHLYLPGIVWIGGGVLIAGGWAYEKYCRFEKTGGVPHGPDAPYDCGACGLFGHKIPWILLIGCGLIDLFDSSEAWSAYTAFAIALALFSLAGSFCLMRFSKGKPAGPPKFF